MAGFFQQFLRGAVDGFLGSPYLKDYTHASKTFTKTGFANAPKFKWLFHVYFDINKTAITSDASVFPDTTNYGLLVKSIDLPKYNIQVQELNQYNRKRLIQTKINYEPIRITFHDDNANQIRHLWQTYYNYYYYDTSQPFSGSSQSESGPSGAASAVNKRNIYDDDIARIEDWGYAGEISSANLTTQLTQKTPFFKAIKIFGFNQHNYALYQIMNPLIENFSHDTYSYNETTGTMESSMAIKYEYVKYYSGALNGQNPSQIVDGFGDPGVYDTDLSPISRPGSNRSIMGQGGLFDAGIGILNDLDPENPNILRALQTAGRVSRTFKNSQQILQAAKSELVSGVIGAVSNPQTVRSVINFPAAGATDATRSQTTNATNAKQIYAPPVAVPANNPIGRGGGDPGG